MERATRDAQAFAAERDRPLIAPESISIRGGLKLLAADPLRTWKHASPRHRLATQNLGKSELYVHSSNKWGKTTLGAAWGVALSRGMRKLDGETLPRLPLPCVGIVLSLDYEQQKDSVQKAYLKAVGDWPHVPEWDGEILKSLRVKWEGCTSDDPKDWSVIRFRSQENRKAGVGARCNWCHADEPPRESIWREVRKAGEPGWPFPRFITATPLSRSQWAWLRADYPVESEGIAGGTFMRIRGDLEDVRGRILSDEEIAELVTLYASDPLIEARLHGYEIDTDGMSPFRQHYDELRRWLDACYPGDLREWKVSRETTTAQGKVLITEVIEYEVWEDPDPMCTYRIVADPSLGIDDSLHDPGEIVVWNVTRGTQALRYNGYIGEYGLGVLAAGLERLYVNTITDPDVTGGYGSAFLTGFRAAGGRKLSVRQAVVPTGGVERTDVGFTINGETRREFVSGILEALLHSKAGHPWLTVRSKETVGELMDLVLDQKLRPVTSPGRHDEGFVTTGRIASLLAPGNARARVLVPVVRKSPREVGRKAMLEKMGITPRAQIRGGVRPRGRTR